MFNRFGLTVLQNKLSTAKDMSFDNKLTSLYNVVQFMATNPVFNLCFSK